jgi:hypothetical protein
MEIFTVQEIMALNSVVRIIIFIGSIHGFANKTIPLATHIFSTMHVVRLVVPKRAKVWDQLGAATYLLLQIPLRHLREIAFPKLSQFAERVPKAGTCIPPKKDG